MLNRNALLLFAGAAMIALDATAASAQDTTTTRRTTRTTSQRRIPVSKESSGEVATTTTVRVDTVTVYKTDTLQMPPRVDTVTNTVTRTDTVVHNVPMMVRQIGGLYFGLAGGGNVPAAGLRSVNNVGATGQLQLGWQGVNSPLGIRGDVQYTQYAEAAPFSSLGAKPDVWNGNLDLKLQIPIAQHLFGSSVSFSPYLIGGGSYVRYRNLRIALENENLDTQAGTTLAGFDNDWHDDFGWNVGGGLSWHMARHEVFVESRLITFNRGTANNGVSYKAARQVPIVFGVNFF
jgi:hypothetical protein